MKARVKADVNKPRKFFKRVDLGLPDNYTLGNLLDMCDQNLDAQIQIYDDGDYYNPYYGVALVWEHTETPEEVTARVAKEEAARAKREAGAEKRKQQMLARAARKAAEQEAAERAIYEKLKSKFGDVSS